MAAQRIACVALALLCLASSVDLGEACINCNKLKHVHYICACILQQFHSGVVDL